MNPQNQDDLPEQFVGALISHTAHAWVFGAAQSDNETWWPFPEPFWRMVLWPNEARLVRDGHPDNGSGAVMEIQNQAIKRIIKDYYAK